MSVIPKSAVVVVDFLVASLAADHSVCAAGPLYCVVVVEGLGSAVIFVFLSLYFLRRHFVLVWYSLDCCTLSVYLGDTFSIDMRPQSS